MKTYEKYKNEAEEKWGKLNVARSEQIVKSWGKAKFAAIKAEGQKITEDLAELISQPVDSEAVQKAIDRHFYHIIQFYDPAWPHLKIYRGLASMYVADPRFAKNYTKYHPKMAEFMKKAMEAYCDRREK